MEENFKTIAVKDIRPDPNQPRKYYDDASMKELAQSIKEKGVLQPILIRPNGNGYILVCGERRLRASKDAGLNDIPAVIRELSDDEALELQIIENLQRKDVHALEEAVAFKSLVENKNKPTTIEDVAARVGKSVYYVRQRMKLNSLSKEWQDVFFKGKINIVAALMISRLDETAQAYFFSNRVSKKDLKDPDYQINISDWDINRLQRKLTNAPFDTKDETLNPKMGPCTTCPFNSAVSSLFPEDAKNPICGNASCYGTKSEVSFDRKLKDAKIDPAIVFVDNETYRSRDDDNPEKIIEKLKKEGHTVYKRDYSDSQYHQVNTGNKDFKKNLETGKYLKAFVLSGDDRGHHIHIELNKKPTASSKQAADKIKSGDASLDDIANEIKRINDREKRTKELDLEKVHLNIVEQLKDHKSLKESKPKFNKTDRAIMIDILLTTAGFSVRDKIKKAIPHKEATYGSGKYQYDYFKQFEKITDDQLAQLVRLIAVDKYSTSLAGSSSGTALRMIAEYLPDIDIKKFEKEQAEVAARRNERIAGRISSLNKKKSELKPKAQTKKPVKNASKSAVAK